jgi:hypothetical protein
MFRGAHNAGNEANITLRIYLYERVREAQCDLGDRAMPFQWEDPPIVMSIDCEAGMNGDVVRITLATMLPRLCAFTCLSASERPNATMATGRSLFSGRMLPSSWHLTAKRGRRGTCGQWGCHGWTPSVRWSAPTQEFSRAGHMAGREISRQLVPFNCVRRS